MMITLEDIRTFCLALPGATEDVKWGNDLCFCVGKKMFCVAGLTGPLHVSFKVTDEEFEVVSTAPGFLPAPYVARYKWVLLEDVAKISRNRLDAFVMQSYSMVKSKLPKKVLKDHGLL